MHQICHQLTIGIQCFHCSATIRRVWCLDVWASADVQLYDNGLGVFRGRVECGELDLDQVAEVYQSF